jgi:hypothetical protein
MPSAVWRLMQAIETNRHRADVLEARSQTASPGLRRLFIDIAAQRRALAEQRYAMARRTSRPAPIPPVKF